MLAFSENKGRLKKRRNNHKRSLFVDPSKKYENDLVGICLDERQRIIETNNSSSKLAAIVSADGDI